MKTVRILIADDHELMRRGLVSILTEAHPEWEIVAEAANGHDAIEKAEALRPDVAILDLSMPGLNGLEVTERLSSSRSGIKIVVLTVHATEPVAQRLRRAGASAFLSKTEAPFRLIMAVESVLSGRSFFSGDYSGPFGKGPVGRVPAQYLLTRRELDVLRTLARGCSNKEVASTLGISVRTAESHRAHIFSRLGVESLGDLVKLAIQDGVA